MNMFAAHPAKTPQEYIDSLPEPRRSELQQLHAFIRETVPQLEPYMESGMLGYGKRHYKYASGREGDWPLVSMASRKQYISVYVNASDGQQYLVERYKAQLPKASIGKSCIRFKHIADIDLAVLATILRTAAAMPQGV